MSIQLNGRAIAALTNGATYASVASDMRVSVWTVRKLWRQHCDAHGIEPAQHRGRPPIPDDTRAAAVRLIRQNVKCLAVSFELGISERSILKFARAEERRA